MRVRPAYPRLPVNTFPCRGEPMQSAFVDPGLVCDLTQQAQAGASPEVVGREPVARSVLFDLMAGASGGRDRLSIPVLVGEAGAGRTATMRRVARKIAEHPSPLPRQPWRVLEALPPAVHDRDTFTRLLDRLGQNEGTVILHLADLPGTAERFYPGYEPFPAYQLLTEELERRRPRLLFTAEMRPEEEQAWRGQDNGWLEGRYVFRPLPELDGEELRSVLFRHIRYHTQESPDGLPGVPASTVEALGDLARGFVPGGQLPGTALGILREVREYAGECGNDTATRYHVAEVLSRRTGLPAWQFLEPAG